MENGLNYVSSVPGRHLGYPGLVTDLKVTQCLQFTEFLEPVRRKVEHEMLSHGISAMQPADFCRIQQ